MVLFKYFGGGEIDCSLLAAPPTPNEGPPPVTPTSNEEPPAAPIQNEDQQAISTATPTEEPQVAPPTTNDGPSPVVPPAEMTAPREDTPTKMAVEELELPTCNVANAMVSPAQCDHSYRRGILSCNNDPYGGDKKNTV